MGTRSNCRFPIVIEFIECLDLTFFFLIAFKASKKKTMIKEGLLDKYGRKNDKTPKEWINQEL